jgi:hypothetical protein
MTTGPKSIIRGKGNHAYVGRRELSYVPQELSFWVISQNV